MGQALVVSAISNARCAEELGLSPNGIILSCKVSHVQDLITVYKDLSARCDYPLHLGLTEAGMGSKGIVASTAGLRSEEHTSELQSLMRISYAVFCLKKKIHIKKNQSINVSKK